jgi:hypothetical protein
MTAEEEKAALPATKGDVQAERWSINATTLVSTGGALGFIVLTLLGGGWYITDKAFAAGKEGAQQVVAPLVPRVVFLEQTQPFLLTEVRAVREEQRAAAEQYRTGIPQPILARPLPPLPVAADGGRP